MTLSNKLTALKNLSKIPDIGKSIAENLYHIGINDVADLIGKDPELLYEQSNKFAGSKQDICLLYVFRCAVYFAEAPEHKRVPEKLKWWWWKDGK